MDRQVVEVSSLSHFLSLYIIMIISICLSLWLSLSLHLMYGGFTKALRHRLLKGVGGFQLAGYVVHEVAIHQAEQRLAASGLGTSTTKSSFLLRGRGA